MRRHQIGTVLSAALAALIVVAGPALADVPVGFARYVTQWVNDSLLA